MRYPLLHRPVVRLALFLCFLLLMSAHAGTVRERQTFDTGAAEPSYYTVYLPDGYDTDERAYPVIYLLHGYGGQDTDWVRYGDAAYITDRLIATNAIPPVILVMPDGQNSWYVNSPEYGQYEEAFLRLIEHVDATYRTIPERTSRAIGGLSMGGYGTARCAIKYPEMCAAAAVMSGAVFPTIPEDAEGILSEVFGDPLDTARYQRELPETLLRSWTPDTLRPRFYVTVGDDDTLTPYTLSVQLHRALVEAGAQAQLRVTNGSHAWQVWEEALDDTLRFFSRTFASSF